MHALHHNLQLSGSVLTLLLSHPLSLLSLPRPAGYQNYNTVAKKLDRRVAALGASAVCERGLGDDQHPNGYEAGLDPWLRKLWSELNTLHPLPLGISEVCAHALTTQCSCCACAVLMLCY